MEKKARSKKESGESRRDQSMTIASLSSGIKSHVICLVLFILLWFCHFLAQFSSSIRLIICSEVNALNTEKGREARKLRVEGGIWENTFG